MVRVGQKTRIAIGMFEHPDALEVALLELAANDVGHEALCLVASAEVSDRQRNGVDGPVLRSAWLGCVIPSGESLTGDWLVTSGHALQPAMQAGACRVDAVKRILGKWMSRTHVDTVATRLAEGWLLLCVALEDEFHKRAVPSILLKHAAASVQVHEFTPP